MAYHFTDVTTWPLPQLLLQDNLSFGKTLAIRASIVRQLIDFGDARQYMLLKELADKAYLSATDRHNYCDRRGVQIYVATGNFLRNVGFYVSPRINILGVFWKTVWHSEEAYLAHKAGRERVMREQGLKARLAYDRKYLSDAGKDLPGGSFKWT